MIQAIRVWHSHDGTAIGIRGVKPFHAEEMDLYIFKSNDRVRVWTNLPVRFFES
jgi:hypothetical protein